MICPWIFCVRYSSFTLFVSFFVTYYVFVEVSEYLVPNHLLQLARTCSTLRAIFMSRSSEIIWRTARKRFYAMPDPPAGMSEPMYIHLAFGDACDVSLPRFSGCLLSCSLRSRVAVPT